MEPGISFVELLQYTELETNRWREWFAAHPDVLDTQCDIARAGTVRQLLQHIFSAELFFAHAVLDLPMPDLDNLPTGTVDELFGIGDDSRRKFQQFLAAAHPEQWNEIREIKEIGNLKASRRKMIAQALLHGVHHRGQLATFLRQRGYDGMWIHDLLLTDVMR